MMMILKHLRRWNSIYLTRRDNQLDPITGDNHYFIDYNDYQNIHPL